MNIFKSFIILLYLVLYLVIGGALIVLAFNVFSLDQIIEGVNFLYTAQNLKLAMGVIGIMFILIGILSAQISFGKMHREKTIAFENPDGQVVVSLAAIEEFIKRMVKEMPQVKELKSAVTASKKGINVISRATLFSDSNIPEITEKIQSMIKTKLLEMLGIEEAISVKIHVTKLLHRDRAGKEEPTEPKEASRHIPFRGIE